MFWSKTTTNRISQLHKRAIRLVDNSRVFPFDEFLENGSFTVHHYSQHSDSFNRDVQAVYLQLVLLIHLLDKKIHLTFVEIASFQYWNQIQFELILNQLGILDQSSGI